MVIELNDSNLIYFEDISMLYYYFDIKIEVKSSS